MKLDRRTFLQFSAGALLQPRGDMQMRGAVAAEKPSAGGLSRKPFQSSFIDMAATAGLTQPVIYGGIAKKNYIIEANGCGCAFLDYDNDGWLDIFLLSGTRLEGDPPEAGNRLYHNNRNGTFTDVTKKAGLEAVGWASGVCIGDYDNDGFDDIFCTFLGQNRLYRNQGDGTFKDVTRQAGLLTTGNRWGAGCSFVDYNRDGHLDLFVSNYLQFDLAKVPKPGSGANCNWKGIPVNCGPRGLPYGRHMLFRNNGDGTFTDVTEQAGISGSYESYGMTVVTADFDEDGWPDIYVACDSTPSLLFMNQKNGTFKEQAIERGVALSAQGGEEAGMGVAVGDYDLDGHLDIFKTHFAEDTNVLYRNDGKGYFDDRTHAARLGAEARFVSWGAGLFDFDNSGYPDIFFVTGSVYPEVEKLLPGTPDKSPRILFRNLGDGTFEELTEAGPALAQVHSSRGCAFGDFDNDGDMDILILNMNEPPSLLRNDVTGHHHWLKVLLVGTESNRSAIGSRVLARYGTHTQAQSVMSQSSYYSCNDFRLHFGLGDATSVELEIFWASGTREKFSISSCDRLVTIQEKKGIIPNRGWGRSK